VSSFTGFPTGTLDLLRGLRENNSRAWFEAHREDYERFYLGPAREFVLAAGERLQPISPTIHAEPRILGSIFRINRDTRFSKDKRPYKDHMDFWFWEGDRKAAVSGFFARVSPDVVGIGAGCHGFSQAHSTAFRKAVGDRSIAAELERVATGLSSGGYALAGEVQPRSHFLYVHVDEPVEEATRATLLDTCERHWRALLPLHRWLVDHVQAGEPVQVG
jgi:uncharacterized protein (TIGR02453 family)